MLAYNRNNVNALTNIARCKVLLGAVDEAIPLLEQAMRLSPRDPQSYAFYEWTGRAHLLQSRTDEAIIWFEKARSVASPTYPFIHAFLAAAHGLKGKIDDAAAELAEARRLGGVAFMSSIARLKADNRFETPAGRALNDATLYTGLRKAGVPEE